MWRQQWQKISGRTRDGEDEPNANIHVQQNFTAIMTTAPPQQGNLDRFVVIHVATTCDEHGVYVTKDSAEVIELGWILLDAKNCEELYRESVLVKPINTPITPLCSTLYSPIYTRGLDMEEYGNWEKHCVRGNTDSLKQPA